MHSLQLNVFFSDVSIECFEKSKKHQALMPLQSLKNFTILYCGTRPNTIIPRQSRSVSPVKDNNNTAEKPKPVLQGSLRRTTSPTRQGQRSLTQSTPMYVASQRRVSEKNDSVSASATTNKNSQNSSLLTSKNGKTILPTIPRLKQSSAAKSKTENETENRTGNVAKDAGDKVRDNSDVESEHDDVNENVEGDSNKSETRKERAGSIVTVVDTLAKTTDSLNEANSALGRLSLSLNQGGITDSLLEEVRLKMTHAESVGSTTKPNSAQSSRDRENLERGN